MSKVTDVIEIAATCLRNILSHLLSNKKCRQNLVCSLFNEENSNTVASIIMQIEENSSVNIK